MDIKKKNKRTTIYDIARAADTSTATVSRVLNNSDYPVNEELKKRVIATAKKLKYTPNLLGRQLKNNVSNDIGVIIPNISNPFYPQLVLGVEHTARERGYNVLLCNSHRNPRSEKKYLQSLAQKQIKGLVISSITKKHDYLKQLKQNDVKIVAFEQEISLDCTKISFDYYQGGYLAAQHLVDCGHRDIGFVSAPLNRYSRKKVYEGFTDYLRKNDIPIREEFFLIAQIEEESYDEVYEFKNGKRLAGELASRQEMPTGVFCINDMTAFGVMQELLRKGIDVPGDISVVGFDNIAMSQMTTPPLTTIDQSTYEMGSMAAEVLINSMEDERRKSVSIYLKPSLIVRETTRRI